MLNSPIFLHILHKINQPSSNPLRRRLRLLPLQLSSCHIYLPVPHWWPSVLIVILWCRDYGRLLSFPYSNCSSPSNFIGSTVLTNRPLPFERHEFCVYTCDSCWSLHDEKFLLHQAKYCLSQVLNTDLVRKTSKICVALLHISSSDIMICTKALVWHWLQGCAAINCDCNVLEYNGMKKLLLQYDL